MPVPSFPIGKSLSKINKTRADHYVLIYFNCGGSDKEYGATLDAETAKYQTKLNIGPEASLETILRVIRSKKLPKLNRLNIKIMGHHQAMELDSMQVLAMEARKIGGHSLNHLIKIISEFIDLTRPGHIKINLHSCETGILPAQKAFYASLFAGEGKYKGSAMITRVRIPSLTSELAPEMLQTTMGFIANKLFESRLTDITISGINGILLSSKGQTTAVISKKIYGQEISAIRQAFFTDLKSAIESGDSHQLAELEADDFLMHARKTHLSLIR